MASTAGIDAVLRRAVEASDAAATDRGMLYEGPFGERDLAAGREMTGDTISPQPGPNGRGAGSLTWGGIFNSYYWIDPQRRIAAAIMSQFLPFADWRALALYGAFERAVYEASATG